MQTHRITSEEVVVTGAENLLENFLDELKGKRVAVVANHTSMIGEEHLVDVLLDNEIQVVRVFAPEHGFRGTADAGASVKSGTDQKTGLPITSLYGKNKKPAQNQLKEVDIVLFDIQDVGVRFYTYISTMHLVMEACADYQISCWILDRPNPNGFYVDGPLLESEKESFIGMHPVPIVHGLTIGELAQMIQGEGWLDTDQSIDLRVVPCIGYEHNDLYQLPIKPSPNLPNMTSIYLYPSLGLFEGTPISIGRGTDFPFQVVGHPSFRRGNFYFTPTSREGAKNPKLKGKQCNGFDLQNMNEDFAADFKGIYLNWLLLFHSDWMENQTEPFFNQNGFFALLAGTDSLRKAIESGEQEKQIKSAWNDDLEEYMLMRKKYLLYPDFSDQ